jgi:hypothetical protein
MKRMSFGRIAALFFLFLAIPTLPRANSFTSKAQGLHIQRIDPPPKLEGTVWESSQEYVSAFQELHTMKFVCSFGTERNVTCNIIVTAHGRYEHEKHMNPITRKYEDERVFVPGKVLLSGERNGTYKQDGNSIQINAASECVIDATIQDTEMNGEISLVLRGGHGVTTTWKARRTSGESNEDDHANKNPQWKGIRILADELIKTEEGFRPAKGYRWLNPKDPNDLQVELVPGLIKTEDGLHPAKGYRWVNQNNPQDRRVERVP